MDLPPKDMKLDISSSTENEERATDEKNGDSGATNSKPIVFPIVESKS